MISLGYLMTLCSTSLGKASQVSIIQLGDLDSRLFYYAVVDFEPFKVY